MSVMPAQDQINGPDTRLNSGSGWAQRSVAILFAAVAVVAMAGWLYLLGWALWAALNWLIFF
jgi:hypothetical protein